MLKEKYESLRILESMQNGGHHRPASNAGRVPFTPRPVRNAVLALVAALVVGLEPHFC